jgi:hypothetical protein
MDAKDPKMVRGEFAPQARLTQHIKDVCGSFLGKQQEEELLFLFPQFT